MSVSESGREKLLASARADGPEAFGRLLLGYESYLILITRARLGAGLRRKVDPADIVQATFLDAHHQFKTFRGTTEAELTAWLRAILAGQIALVTRRFLGTSARDIRLERQIERDLADSTHLLEMQLIAPDSTPSHRAVRREQAVLLAEALTHLPETYREVIVLRHVEGLSFVEVATRMNKTHDSVQKLWVRSLAKLREALEKAGIGND